jgi:hypothetical protein
LTRAAAIATIALLVQPFEPLKLLLRYELRRGKLRNEVIDFSLGSNTGPYRSPEQSLRSLVRSLEPFVRSLEPFVSFPHSFVSFPRLCDHAIVIRQHAVVLSKPLLVIHTATAVPTDSGQTKNQAPQHGPPPPGCSTWRSKL